MTVTGLTKQSAAGPLSKYDPDKGLKQIAVAEAAEKHFARAKDATKLQQAIRAKLEAQAEFVYWWKTRDKNKAGRPKKSITDQLSIMKDEELAKTLGTRLMTISRWKSKLDDPQKFEDTYNAACAHYLRILELDQTAHVGQNSGENEWYTPVECVEAARAVLGGIDLDPATTAAANAVVKAAHIFTAEDNGLTQPWRGRVWMNPPYSQPLIEDFCEKFAGHAERGEIAGIVLVNNATETTWFQRLASASMCFCFPKGRIRFWSPRGQSATPLQGQVICYTGADTETFSRAFRSFGFIAERTA